MKGDALSLQDFLAAMRRIGTPPEYQAGYEQGFTGVPVANWKQTDAGEAYRRGHWAGVRARERGAHREASERQVS